MTNRFKHPARGLASLLLIGSVRGSTAASA
jgi:hypothetical protein